MATRKPIRKKSAKPKEVESKKPVFTKKKQAFLDALRENLGIVSKAADQVSIHRNTVYLWKSKDPAFKAEMEAIDDDCIDVVENQLMNNILSGDVASIIFYLKTKAKKRGYVEKSEVGLTDKEGNDVVEQVIVIGGREIKF